MSGAAEYPLVAVVGPTCSGKSRLAAEVARRHLGEIVNCDSLQIYRGLDIGTAKTPAAERGLTPHHLFDLLEPWEVTSAGDYARRARQVIAEIRRRQRLPVIAGGTGFYLRALLEGLAEGPGRDERLRARLLGREQRRPGSLHRLLARWDSQTAARIHVNDVQKTVRALEICLLERRPAAQVFARGRRALEGFRALKLGLCPKRELLVKRIEERTRAMYANGLVDEVRGLLGAGVPPHAKALEAIGYKEALGVLEGRLRLEKAVEATVIATRQYAKRQMTWFRRDSGIVWLEGFGDEPAVMDAVFGMVRTFLAEVTKIDYRSGELSRIGE